MNQLASNLIVLEPGQTPPSKTVFPPRQPKWFDTFAYIANPDQFCHENFKRYGPIFRTGVFGGTTVLVGSTQANQMVFNGDLNYTEIGLPATTMAMFGEYSLFQCPDLHRQRRSALTPGITGSILAHYAPKINQVIIQKLQTWKTPGSLALFPAVEQICFDVLVPLLLGIDVNASDCDPFVGLPVSSKLQLRKLYKTFFDGFYGLLKWDSPLTTYGRGVRAREQLIEFMRAVIQRRRSQGSNPESINPNADLLSMMLAGQQENPDGVFSDALIENQCLLQLWASHKNIAALISSMMYRLGQHPQVVQRLLEEQAQVLSIGTEDPAPKLSLEQLKQLTFLEATLKETLRNRPLASTINRKLTKDVVLNGMLFKKGWGLIAEPRIAHIMPEHFHEPAHFAPERFLGDRNEGKMYEFIPFGGGIHSCLGAQLTFLVSKIFAFHVLRQFEWNLVGKARFVQFPLKRLRDDYCIELKGRHKL